MVRLSRQGYGAARDCHCQQRTILGHDHCVTHAAAHVLWKSFPEAIFWANRRWVFHLLLRFNGVHG